MISGAARQGIEAVWRKSSGPFLRRLKERRRPCSWLLGVWGARTDPYLERWPLTDKSICLLSRLLALGGSGARLEM